MQKPLPSLSAKLGEDELKLALQDGGFGVCALITLVRKSTDIMFQKIMPPLPFDDLNTQALDLLAQDSPAPSLSSPLAVRALKVHKRAWDRSEDGKVDDNETKEKRSQTNSF